MYILGNLEEVRLDAISDIVALQHQIVIWTRWW